LSVASRFGDRLRYPGRSKRRSWEGGNRIHLEVRGLDGPGAPAVGRAVERALLGIPGVAWAEVDYILGRVVAQLEDSDVTVDEVLAALEAAESAGGVGTHRFAIDRPEHPGDDEAVLRQLLAFCADVAGLGVGVGGRLLQATPLPTELASLVSLVDYEPRLRHFFEAHFGAPVTDLGLAVVNAAGQGLSQGPLGLTVDGLHRVNLLREALARRGAFERAEQRRWAAGPATADPFAAEPCQVPAVAAALRPRPLPDGRVEHYGDRAAVTAAAAAAVTAASTRSPRRAAAVLLSGISKAARLGREAFAAELALALSRRDLLVMDRGALRRLDRVDTVVIDASLLETGRSVVAGIRLLEGADAPEVHRRLSSLFDPSRPELPRTRGRWSLGAPTAGERRRKTVRAALVELGGDPVLILRAARQPVAVMAVREELSAGAVHLVGAARRQELMVVLAGADSERAQQVGADLAVAGGGQLADAVRELQVDGCVVALMAPGGHLRAEALRIADVGIELPALDGSAWAGAIVVNEVADGAFILDAMTSARHVSRQSVALSATGSGVGALFSLGGLAGSAAGRATDAVNVAALASMANGIRAARYVDRHGGHSPAEATRWHELGTDQVLDRLASGSAGLSGAEADRRREDVGGVSAPRPSLLASMVGELANPLTPVLGAGAAASAAVGSPADAGIVAGVTALNAVVGGLQRYGAERAIVALTRTSQTQVTVRRDGRDGEEPADSLVPGDVVRLAAGDAVPADCRVLDTVRLEVDESSLTGESDTVTKDPNPTFSSVLAERSSMLYEGSTVAAGEATAIVVAVGAETAANAMAAEVDAVSVAGGVEARLRQLTSVTLPVAAAAGGAVLGLSLLRGQGLRPSVGSAVALAVAAVPEGLPILATMAQLASARRLSGRHALVRNPRAIEALGRVQVLCTDKTGTLTEGRIALRRVSDGVEDVALADLPEGLMVTVAAALRATPVPKGGDQLPHPTDRAVVAGAAERGIETDRGAPGWQRGAELPFEPTRGYHAVAGATEGAPLLSVKGAPETVIPRCRRWRRGDTTAVIDVAARHRLDREVERLARQGLRVLAVGERRGAPAAARGGRRRPSAPSDGGGNGQGDLTDEEVSGLTLLGFLVLSDPVRPTAAQAVRALRAAGVDVVMVTGDHPSTAAGIGAELGILNGHRVVTGADLAAMSDAGLDAIVSDVSVFARVTPADKVRIVAALQRLGKAVAMTGDGANDAPAIRLADVGVALGDGATPAARRAADLIVTDERIETIVDAIAEGRGMWSSLRDALAILLGGNLGEVAFTVAATAVSGRAPLSARQLLTVNLLTDVAPALAIALRPPPARPPEALLAEGPDASLGRPLERAIAVRAAATAAGAGLAWSAAKLTGRDRRASTIALVALVGSQLGQTVVSNGRPDPVVVLAGGASAAVLAVIVQTPGLSQFFGCTPLGPVGWGIGAGSAVLATAASLAADHLLDLS
jgi:cation-transporting ATPase I